MDGFLIMEGNKMNAIIERTVELENGSKVNFRTDAKYPFWGISFERGGVPSELSGKYTDFDKALEAVKNYVERRAVKNRTTVKAGIEERVK